jgi:hypothetical protein
VIVIAWQEDPSALQPVPLNKVPVLSFEEAAKPLLDTVPDLTAKLADCRKLIGENRALIPKEVHASASSGYYVCTTAACPWQVGDDGAAALALYSAEWKPSEDAFYILEYYKLKTPR